MTHLNKDGKFQSDKYPWSHPDFMPLKFSDPMAQDLIWEYARRRHTVDVDFSLDVSKRLTVLGYKAFYQKELDEAMELARKTEDPTGIWSKSAKKLGRALLHLLPRTGKPMKVSVGLGHEQVDGFIKDGIFYVPLASQDDGQEHTGR